MSSKNLQNQISKLQSQLDSKKSVKVKEKVNSTQRRRSRSRTPKRGTDLSVRDKKIISQDLTSMKYKGRFNGHLDFAKARAAINNIKPVLARKDALSSRLAESLKNNMYVGCVHDWKVYDSKKSVKRCDKCAQYSDQVKDEKTVVLTNTDDIKALYDMVTKELDLAVGAMRAGLGNRPIHMRLSAPFTITTTVTTGVTNSVTINGNSAQLNPSYMSEWATMAALFEEYKMLGGEFDFIYNNPSPGDTDTTNLTMNQLPVIAYDADDGTQATSSVSLTQSAQHEVLTPSILWASAGRTVNINVSGPATGTRHHFKFKIPKGDVVPSTVSSVSTESGTGWIPVNGVLNSGWVKFYHIGTGVTAKDTGAGVVYFNLMFRCRS